MKSYDVIIVGGGIMGVLGAYELTNSGLTVALIDRRSIGNKHAGSSGLTRSLRSDYESPIYAKLAAKSWDRWQVLQAILGIPLVHRVGCLNVAQTTQQATTYAQRAEGWLKRDGRRVRTYTSEAAVKRAYSQFDNFNFAVEEFEAGLGFPNVALQTIRNVLGKRCALFENATIERITTGSNAVEVRTKTQTFRARKLIIAAGLGSPGVLETIEGLDMVLPLTADRPTECVYYIPKRNERYIAGSLPVFACLDQGIYGHPIVLGKTTGVKIGRYMPPASVNKELGVAMQTIDEFVRQHMPNLAQQAIACPVTDTDRCSYDMTPDGGFLVGALSAIPHVFIATGFCGTGYKFAPVVAQLMTDFALNKPLRYQIELFDPERYNV